jgi:hypothetical protein
LTDETQNSAINLPESQFLLRKMEWASNPHLIPMPVIFPLDYPINY